MIPIKGKWLSAREKFGSRDHWFSEPLFIDTETSHADEFDGWIHQWDICWNYIHIKGRRAEELIDFLTRVESWARSHGKHWKVLSYIHNLGYDMEYMRAYYPEEEPKFFAVKPHRILTAKWKNLETRCSYLLTGKALAKWAKDSRSRYPKLSDTYDYKKVRTPEDLITDREWTYQFNDTAAMCDSWHNDRAQDGYTVLDVPLTVTGFVRADFRAAANSDHYWSKKLYAMQPDIKVYDGLEEAFAGGYTHGNRFYKNVVVSAPIGHRDFRSSYPTRQMLNTFPMGKFEPIDIDDPDEIYDIYETNALLLHIAIKDPHLKNRAEITAPYLSASKCNRIGEFSNELLDNGRVIEFTGIAELWITEYDYFILSRQYDMELQFLDCYAAPKGKLPKWFRDKIMQYFEHKTTLKHVDPILYMLSKGKLNGAYGMTAQKNIRDILEYLNGEWNEIPLQPDSREAALMKHINKETTFLPFAWGVWTTALARYALFECIETIGYERFLYADTDSIFYLMNSETEQAMESYNQKITELAIRKGAAIEYQGETVALGVFTQEEDMPIQKFTFVHAKCYALVDKEGKESVTVAGVTKRWRSDPTKTNADELGDISNLKTGFIFKECGGSRITYNNKPLHTIVINGVAILCGASAIISDTEYKVHDLNSLDTEDMEIRNMILGCAMSDIYGTYMEVK